MSERYSRLFTLPENLYAVGSPVVIAAGALLKDNQTGKIVAQLKLRSISNKIIRAVKVSLSLFDTAGNPIGNVVEYEYLDLDASRDTEFGQKNPVFVAESKARSYKAAVQEVVFVDKTTWTAGDAAWEPLPAQKTLDAVLVNAELIKQYKITVGSNLSYYPLEEKDLWYCACGALNRENESCHTCHRSLFELQTIDLEQLAKDKDARLAREAAAAEAKAAAKKAAMEAAKKKTAKILKIAISSICAVITIALLMTKVIIPNSKYNDAVALMDAGKYEEAIASFESLDGFRDAEQQIVICQDSIKELIYQNAVEMIKKESYDDALSVLLEIKDYKDSNQLIADCKKLSIEEQYKSAIELMNAEKYENAKKAFEVLNGYKDSRSLIQKCDQLILEAKKNQAIQRLKNKNYSGALALLKELQNAGMDVQTEIQECEIQILESGAGNDSWVEPIVTSGKPKGKETKVSASASGKVKLHKLTRVNLDNGCVRFMLDCTAPKCDFISFFNPPNGNLFMYAIRNIKEGRQTFTFDVTLSDIKAASSMSIKLGHSNGDSWIFVNNPY